MELNIEKLKDEPIEKFLKHKEISVEIIKDLKDRGSWNGNNIIKISTNQLYDHTPIFVLMHEVGHILHSEIDSGFNDTSEAYKELYANYFAFKYLTEIKYSNDLWSDDFALNLRWSADFNKFIEINGKYIDQEFISDIEKMFKIIEPFIIMNRVEIVTI